MKLKSIALGLCAVFFMCNQGYCLFRDDVSAQQVESAMKIQKAKDEQRKKQNEQVKLQEADKVASAQNGSTDSSQPAARTSSKTSPSAAVITPIAAKSMPQYKRLAPNGTIIDTPQPFVAKPAPIAKQEVKKPSYAGLIFLLLILGVGGLIAFKQKNNK
jgi:hypothetical protein